MKKSLRLTKNLEYKRVYRSGRRWSSPFFTMYIKKNHLGHSRLGVSVSKKVGKSVVRNKVKRRVKEAFRKNIGNISKGNDIVISAKPPVVNLNFDRIEQELKSLFRRGRIWNDKKVSNGNNNIL